MGLFTRSKPGLNSIVNENKTATTLNRFCQQLSFSFINNDNIDIAHLAEDGLLLNYAESKHLLLNTYKIYVYICIYICIFENLFWNGSSSKPIFSVNNFSCSSREDLKDSLLNALRIKIWVN